MEGESSYESDISESWSLIDINLNEELVSITDAQPKLEETYLPDPKDITLKKSDSIGIEDFVRQCKESLADFNRSCHSDSSLENQEFLKIDESERGSEQDKNDSGDAESIEILDMDRNHIDSEIERELRQHTYQADDEELWGGNVDNKIRSISSTVIKRKRNLVRSSESSDNIVNSDIIPNENSNLSNHSSDEKKLKLQSDATSNQQVYKHYRNNVVNTVLSLSMGVIFAGVACIAIGHFFGVQDAAVTAVELVNALKKLQMENAALQSRLSQFNRAVLKRNVNSKFELPPAKPQETVSCKERPNYGLDRTKSTSINEAALSEIRSSLKSIQWLTELENVLNGKGGSENKQIDFGNTGKYIYDQLNVLNNKKVEGIKLLEDSDKKISKVLQKIIERLSASHENIEKLYSRLIRMKDKMNHKLRKLFPDLSPRKMPLMQGDLNFKQWCPNVGNVAKESDKSIRIFKFPQPEEFYKVKNVSVLREERAGTKKNNKTKKEMDERKFKKEGKRRRKEKEKNLRREKSKNVVKKLQKKPKHNTKMSEKMTKKYSGNEPARMKYTFGTFNKTNESYKIVKEDEERHKQKIKKSKTSRALQSRRNKGNNLKKNRYGRICSRKECFNLSGNWVFKYADGREEFRRHQTLGDWQFERAKGRKEQRDGNDAENWQFKRASARENGRNDHRWRPERYRKNYSQDFFHEGFSWI